MRLRSSVGKAVVSTLFYQLGDLSVQPLALARHVPDFDATCGLLRLKSIREVDVPYPPRHAIRHSYIGRPSSLCHPDNSPEGNHATATLSSHLLQQGCTVRPGNVRRSETTHHPPSTQQEWRLLLCKPEPYCGCRFARRRMACTITQQYLLAIRPPSIRASLSLHICAEMNIGWEKYANTRNVTQRIIATSRRAEVVGDNSRQLQPFDEININNVNFNMECCFPKRHGGRAGDMILMGLQLRPSRSQRRRRRRRRRCR
jgi:hypothetical protein